MVKNYKAIFTISEIGNLICHLMLSGMRKAEGKSYSYTHTHTHTHTHTLLYTIVTVVEIE